MSAWWLSNCLEIMIKVFDDFLSEDVQKEVYELLLRPKWHLKGGTSDNPFWHMDNLEEEDYFNTFLFEKIKEVLDLKDGVRVRRIYANGQTAGQCGSPHKDDGDFTFLYYPNLEWKVEDQGHLFFFKDEEVSRVIQYKPNRALVFPAKIMHYADAPSRFYNGLRISLAYKLKV